MSRTQGKDIQSLSEAYSSMYRTEETQPEVLREFEETDDQLADYRARKRREAQAARNQVDSGQEIKARTGLFGNQDTLKKSGTTADGRQILDVTNRGFRLSAPDRSTVIGNRRYDRLTTTDDKGRIRYQYVQAKGQQGQVANPDNAPKKPEPAADAPAPEAPESRPPAPAPAKTYNVGGEKLTKAQIKARYDKLRSDPAAAKKFGDAANRAIFPPKQQAAGAPMSKTQRDAEQLRQMRNRSLQRQGKPMGGPQGPGRIDPKSVQSAVKSANRPEVLNRQAPAGSALRAQQDRLAAKSRQQANTAAAKVNTAAARPTPTAAAKPAGGYSVPAASRPIIRPKPVAAAAPKPAAAAPAPKPAAAAPAPVAKPAPKPAERRRMPEELDVFDTIKGEIIGEGYSEEDAIYIMANLDAEQKELVMNEGIGALLKGAVKVGKKVFGKKAATAAKSAIRSRTDDAVRAQRGGFAGDADEFNQLQQGVTQSLNRLARQERRGGRGAASLAAKKVEADVKRASAYGPQFPKPGQTYGARIEKPKPTGGKIGVEIPKQSSLPAQPPSYKEIMARHRKEFEGKTQSEKDKIFKEYIKRWKARNK
tara:strand:+ start:1535 stop:3310 length:1776 start_codon:yes stop_codon:yes gene_type:complete